MIKTYSIKLYNENCLEGMKRIPDNSVDLVLTDPPYGIDFCSSMTNRKERLQNDKFGNWKDMLTPMLREFKRILTDTGCCCCCCGGGKAPVTAILTLEAIKYFNLIQTLVWKKYIGLGWRYRPAYENILILSKSKDDYNFYDTSKRCSNVIENINQDIPQSDEHPTQKPVSLMKHLLQIHSNENDLVCDPFFGSGTTAVACKNLGRNFIGFEIDKTYYEMAKSRIEHTEESLFHNAK